MNAALLRASPLGIIGGTAFLETDVDSGRMREVVTTHGTVVVHDAGDFIFLQRHGEQTYRPPHRIPHHAHVLALESLGVRAVVGFASAGALHPRLRPGDIVIPEDYLSWHTPPTFASDEYLHIVPSLDPELRELLISAAHRVAGENAERRTIAASGVYAQMTGPRFETKAEIRMLSHYADIVGMTAASEATLCQERSIGYAMICMVDNWANGVGPTPLTLDEFQAQVARNTQLARALLLELGRLWRDQSLMSKTQGATP